MYKCVGVFDLKWIFNGVMSFLLCGGDGFVDEHNGFTGKGFF
jgi:hypothetical protein